MAILRSYISYPTFRYVFWFRIVQSTKKRKITKYTVFPFTRQVLRHYEFKLGIHCNPSIRIDGGLHIAHGDGVYLNAKEIGSNFTCYQGVTIGASGDNQCPVIGSNVTVYMGAKVIGNKVVHDGAVIAANAVVTHDVGKNCVVAGVPARKIKDIQL